MLLRQTRPRLHVAHCRYGLNHPERVALFVVGACLVETLIGVETAHYVVARAAVYAGIAEQLLWAYAESGVVLFTGVDDKLELVERRLVHAALDALGGHERNVLAALYLERHSVRVPDVVDA